MQARSFYNRAPFGSPFFSTYRVSLFGRRFLNPARRMIISLIVFVFALAVLVLSRVGSCAAAAVVAVGWRCRRVGK